MDRYSVSDAATTVLLSVGEASGDLHTANLLSAYQRQHGPLNLIGMGGENLRACGMRIDVPLESVSVTGFTEVIRHFGDIWRGFQTLKRLAREQKPQLAILADFPDFNLRLAKYLKRLGIPVVYFISPQIWAWRFGRIKTIRRYVDHMIVLFPFEAEIYRRHDVDVSYLGHPLVDRFHRFASAATIPETRIPDPSQPFPIALMPGSRFSEVRRLLPTMLRSLPELKKLVPNAEFHLVCAATVSVGLLKSMVAEHQADVVLRFDGTFNVLRDAQLVVVASGTATLEVALFGRPMIIGYRMSWMSYWLARLLIRVKHIGLVNLLADTRIVPELIQRMFTSKMIVAAATDLLANAERFVGISKRLLAVTANLGKPGVAERQSGVIHRMLPLETAADPHNKHESRI